MTTDYKQRFDALKARFPYLFTMTKGPMEKGWLETFEILCEDIDRMGAEEAGFQWVQLKEKFGKASWYFTFTHKTEENEAACYRIAEHVSSAQASTAHICIVCSAPGEIDRSLGWQLALCPNHHALHVARQPLGFTIR